MYITIVAIIIVVIGLIAWLKKDPLSRFEPVSDDELLLLTIVPEDMYEDLLTYARTLKMSERLQTYLSDKKDCLDALSYFMLIQSAKEEQKRKETLYNDVINFNKSLKHVEKQILNRLKM